MDLNTVQDVIRPTRRDHVPAWRAGDAWLAGGTWLFSEPQPAVDRLLDLESLSWPAFELDEQHLTIGATCRIAELHALTGPAAWIALPLVAECCNAFLASFKIWNAATVGGNLCMSLPAGPMIALTTALEGTCLNIWAADGGERRVPIEQFVTGNRENVLLPGELLRAIELPVAALERKTSFRQASLTHLGRSAALLIGTVAPPHGAFALTITGATIRPLRLQFPSLPAADELRRRIDQDVTDGLYFDDVHGDPAYRRHLTYIFAEQIRQELADGGAV